MSFCLEKGGLLSMGEIVEIDESSGEIPGGFIYNCYEWTETIVEAIIPVVFILAFVFRIVSVSGESMLNTLHNMDKVLVIEWYYKPKNGDVVVIRKGQNLDEPLIKRVIATEGQTLEIDFSTGTVTVDGELLEEIYIKEKMWLREDGDIPQKIPKGYSFVMGDNRNNSLDSRSKAVGLIKNEDIKGKAAFVVFPFNRIKSI